MNRDRGCTSALLWAALLVGLWALPAHADWEQTLDYEGEEDAAVTVATDASGNSYVLATCENEDEELDVVVFKLTPAGQEQGSPWACYDSDEEDVAVAMVLDESGGALYVLSAIGDGEDLDIGDATRIRRLVIRYLSAVCRVALV